MEQALKVTWIDGGREPKCPPNPAYPDGIDVDACRPGEQGCVAALPYPAKRCGAYAVECPVCGAKTVVTTAGRPDDPRTVRVACKLASAVAQ